MTKRVDIKADIGSLIRVDTLELKSVMVVGLLIQLDGVTYQISYFHGGDRKTAYLFSNEFELCESQKGG
jgi:hypothetical protein